MTSIVRAWQIVDGGVLANMPVRLPEPGPTEVVVRVGAVALNHRDLLVRAGRYGRAVPVGAVPCSDAAGVIAAIGTRVDRVAVGDRVTTVFAPDWHAGTLTRAALRTTLGSGRTPGVLAEYVCLPETAVHPAPACLSIEEAATLPCAALTAWHALFEGGVPIRRNHTVLTIGSGGVSVFALQMAVRAGATVIAVSGSPGKFERLRELGASHVIDRRSEPGWGERARSLTDGEEGVDLVIEVGGQGTLEQSMRAVHPGGTIALIGTLAGPTPVSLTPLLLRNITLAGIMVGSRAMLAAMMSALSDWRLRPVIDTVVPFAEAPAAFERLASGRQFGKVVVSVP
ncbi:MAG: NAD(P)-dependent alcohol dehydrogenase [Acidobacteriota bacterium]